MLNRIKYILLFYLGMLATFQATGQLAMPDSVCVGAQTQYWVFGEPGSTYTWTLTDPFGNPTTLLSIDDTVMINWPMVPGTYTLSTIQHSVANCNGLPQVGIIEVFEQPIAFAGNPT